MWTVVGPKRRGKAKKEKVSELNKPNTNKPNTNKPNTNKPNTNKPNTNKPNTNKPNTNKPNTTEKKEWQTKYDPRKLKLGMVHPSSFVDVNNKEFFDMVNDRVTTLENHIGEMLPTDFRKYILYCGPVFFNWSACNISLSGWNEEDKDDQTILCLWCKTPLADTKCSCNFFDGTDLDSDDTPGLIRFSHEGCGMFKFIVVKGPLKGSIWSANPNGDSPYLYIDKKSFKELLDSIYKL